MKQSVTLRIGYRYHFRDADGNLQAAGIASCKMTQFSDGGVVAVESVRKFVERELVSDYPEQDLSECSLSITIDAIAVEVAPCKFPAWWAVGFMFIVFLTGGGIARIICDAIETWGGL